jgi:hypothetical protein
MSERICRALLERLTGAPFPKTRPKWLKNERGNQMELDGYSTALNLAFEYQGHQHFKPVSVFHSGVADFRKRQRDDEQKRKLCSKHGVRLLEVPFHIPHAKLQNYLSNALRKIKVNVCHTGHLEIGKLGVWRSGELAKMRSLAISRGGKLLSKFYINEITKLEWICGKGHRWGAKPHDIKRGSWCLVCSRERTSAKNRAHTIDEMRQLAVTKGGVCMSESFQSCAIKLRWRCASGHEWETVPRLIINGHWCPVCARLALRPKAPSGAKSL